MEISDRIILFIYIVICVTSYDSNNVDMGCKGTHNLNKAI